MGWRGPLGTCKRIFARPQAAAFPGKPSGVGPMTAPASCAAGHGTRLDKCSPRETASFRSLGAPCARLRNRVISLAATARQRWLGATPRCLRSSAPPPTASSCTRCVAARAPRRHCRAPRRARHAPRDALALPAGEFVRIAREREFRCAPVSRRTDWR